MRRLLLLGLIVLLSFPLAISQELVISQEQSFDFDYLIILPQKYYLHYQTSAYTGLKDFIDLKEKHGYKLKVTLVEDILQSEQGRDKAEQIKNYLVKTKRDNSKLKYVLLIGWVGSYWYFRDSTDGDIPVRFYCYKEPLEDWMSYYSSAAPWLSIGRVLSDLYYADFSSGDIDNDGYFELPEKLEIDLMVGRIMGNYIEVDKVLKKIVAYENKERNKTALLCGSNLKIETKKELRLYTLIPMLSEIEALYEDKYEIITLFTNAGDIVSSEEGDYPLNRGLLIEKLKENFPLVFISSQSSGDRFNYAGLPLEDRILQEGSLKYPTLLNYLDLKELVTNSVFICNTTFSTVIGYPSLAELLLVERNLSPTIIAVDFMPIQMDKSLPVLSEFNKFLLSSLFEGQTVGEAFYGALKKIANSIKSYDWTFTFFDFLIMYQPFLLGDPSLQIFPPVLRVEINKDSLDFGYVSADTEDKPKELIELSNKGIEAVEYQIEAPLWVEVNSLFGKIEPHESEIIQVTINKSNLKSGVNEDVLVINIKDIKGKDQNITIPIKIRAVIDNLPPKIIIEDFPTLTKEDSIILKGRIMDPALAENIDGSGIDIAEVWLNGKYEGVVPLDFNFEVSLKEGINELLISAKDKVGNKTQEKLIIEKDSIPPLMIIDLASKVKVYEPFIFIKGRIEDKHAVKNLLINGKTVEIKNNSFFERFTLTEGENIFILECEDELGNKNIQKIEITFVKRIIIQLQIGSKTIYVNDVPQEIDVAPVIIEGRTLLPIRYVVEPLGATVGWNSDEKKITILFKEKMIELWIGKSIARVNGVDTPIDPTNPKVVPMIISGRTMLPVRFIAENLGCQVDWDSTTRTVTITYPKD